MTTQRQAPVGWKPAKRVWGALLSVAMIHLGNPTMARPGAGPTSVAELVAAAHTEPEALRLLAVQWGERLPPGEACTALRREAALACFDSRGGLALLRQLDRPVLLRLRLPATAAPRSLLLLGLGVKDATLLVDGRTVRVPLAWLSEFWRGEFLTLWRAPAEHPGGVPQALDKPLSQWLQRQLRPGIEPPVGSSLLQADDLSLRLAGFQISAGLKPDGKPGPVTMMALNRHLGLKEPRLLPLPP